MPIEHVFPWTQRALVRHLLGFLRGNDVLHLTQSHRTCLEAVLPVLQDYQRGAARLALALWCMRNLRIEFEAHYQELETQRIARSRTHDPRVPPRVVPIWSERGRVHGGCVALRPSSLPFVHGDGITAQFAVDAADNKTPMLTNVVQTQRRVYTVVTLKLLQPPSGDRSANDDATVLRQYSYIKDFGEWHAPSATQKQRLDVCGHAPCRFDLLSIDGSVALELDVPAGADALVDYYVVKRAAVSVHIDELLQRSFASLRPLEPLSSVVLAPAAVACVISLHFRTLRGESLRAFTAVGRLQIERRERDASANAPHASRVTGIEHFDIVTCTASGLSVAAASDVNTTAAAASASVPTDPGYLWLRIRAPGSRRSYFHAAVLHHGASFAADGRSATLHARWLPGVLESFPTLASRHRRCLKGHVALAWMCASSSNTLQDVTVVAQHLDAARLARYAATVQSYARIGGID